MSEQLDLFLHSMSLDELGGVVRERAALEGDAATVGLSTVLELAEAISVARGRLPSNQAFGEFWGGLDLDYSPQWRAQLIKIGSRWVGEGRPVIKPLEDGERFSLERYAAGGDPYKSDEPDDDGDDGGPAPGSDEWFTPAWLFDALGLEFDLDVCAPADLEHVTVPARHSYSLPANDGLVDPWYGLAWCNPPYSDASGWAARMIEHGDGLFLSHIPINGHFALDLWRSADALCFFQGMHFLRPDGSSQRPAWWLQLCAYGPAATEALEALPGRIPDDISERWRPGPVWQR